MADAGALPSEVINDINCKVMANSAAKRCTEKALINILTAYDKWQEAKSNWINIIALNEQPPDRPCIPTINSETLGSVFFANKLNLQKCMDTGRKINGYFAGHLLLIHELYCTECYTKPTPNNKDALNPDSEIAPSESPDLLKKQTETSELSVQINTEDDANKTNVTVRNNIGRRTLRLKARGSKTKTYITNSGNTNQIKTRAASNAKNKIIETSKDLKFNKNTKKAKKTEETKLISEKTITDKTSESEEGKDGEQDENDKDSSKSNTLKENTSSDEDFSFNIGDDDDNSTSSESEKEANETNTTSKSSSRLTRYSYKCKQCDRSFNRPGRLKLHVATKHKGKKFSCEVCKKEYNSGSTLKTHMLVHTETPVDCPECGKNYKSSFLLKIHLKKSHPTEKETFHCDSCEKEFHSKPLLKAHQVVHLDNKDFVCDVCGKAFKRKGSLREHKYIHTGGKIYTCDVCGLTFRHNTLVYRHKKEKHGSRDQLCTVCGKAYFTVTQLKRHTLTHSEEPHFKCRECGKGYRSESGLETHMNTHKGIVPNVCHYCGKAFLSQSNMFKHIARHKGIKHHFCNACDKGFITKQELRAHLKVHEIKTDAHVRRTREKSDVTNQEKHVRPTVVSSGPCVFASGGSFAYPHTEAPKPIYNPPSINVCETVQDGTLRLGHTPFTNFEDYRYF